jgi:hypothetical protein
MHATMFGLSHYSDKLGVTLQFAGLASEADDDDDMMLVLAFLCQAGSYGSDK